MEGGEKKGIISHTEKHSQPQCIIFNASSPLERRRKLRLTSFLHLQLSFGLLQNGLDSLIRTSLWGADPGGNVTWKEEKREWEEVNIHVRFGSRDYQAQSR